MFVNRISLAKYGVPTTSAAGLHFYQHDIRNTAAINPLSGANVAAVCAYVEEACSRSRMLAVLAYLLGTSPLYLKIKRTLCVYIFFQRFFGVCSIY